MRILELRLKNLNSLYGEWVIDFTDPAYVESGIFALTGPTGAGKSTILDAICLALYGQTPRLGKITKSVNEIMSRQTGECYAEVLFESQAGVFRCHWEQRRARKKADGALQDQEHQIVDGVTGKPIETKKSLVLGVVEEKTGMDFDRFTRSMLLAQGGFDTFLKADVEQKSKILEQITGTGIYSDISRRVHERHRSENDLLNELTAETRGIEILEPEQVEEMMQKLAEKRTHAGVVENQSGEIKKAIDWLKLIEGLEKELKNLDESSLQLKADLEAFGSERSRLEQANKAAALDGEFATLKALRTAQQEDLASIEKGKEKLPELKLEAERLGKAHVASEQALVKAKDELSAALPMLQQVRSVDQKITDQSASLAQLSARCQQDEETVRKSKHSLSEQEGMKNAAQQKRDQAAAFLQEHANDESLVSDLAGIEEQFKTLRDAQAEYGQKEADLVKAGQALDKAVQAVSGSEVQRETLAQNVTTAEEKLSQGQEQLAEILQDRLLREYKADYKALLREQTLLQRIEELEGHRAKLEDGKPCPLCGALDHPYAQGNVPQLDETEQRLAVLESVIEKAENQEAVIKQLEDALTLAKGKVSDFKLQKSKLENDQKIAQERVAQIQGDLEKLRDMDKARRAALSEKLSVYGQVESDLSDFISVLKRRRDNWLQKVEFKEQIEELYRQAESDVARLSAVLKTQSETLEEKQASLKSGQDELKELRVQRQEIYGDKDPNLEEKRLNGVVSEADGREKQARVVHQRAVELLQKSQNKFDTLQDQIATRTPTLEQAERGFEADLKTADFESEEVFLAVRLPSEERRMLSQQETELDTRKTTLEAQQEDRQSRLETERTKQVTDRSLEELEPDYARLLADVKLLQDEVFAFDHKLKENDRAKERIAEKQEAIEAQKRECGRWAKLHNLIGSSDGKKYRNFAQGLTFELMVSHANNQLVKMSDRYLLTRDPEKPLDLSVIDNHQAGEVRSTKNLSGGESFIVSLTLALGLSKMASRKVRVDSLFLDEGFGTLDQEALDVALNALSELQHDGKLIGVISHVEALKERIGTQIAVQSVSGGRSEIRGAGCEKRLTSNA